MNESYFIWYYKDIARHEINSIILGASHIFISWVQPVSYSTRSVMEVWMLPELPHRSSIWASQNSLILEFMHDSHFFFNCQISFCCLVVKRTTIFFYYFMYKTNSLWLNYLNFYEPFLVQSFTLQCILLSKTYLRAKH